MLAIPLLLGANAFADATEKQVAFGVGTRYVSTVAQGGLDINGPEITDRQTFALIDMNGGELADGDEVRIRWAPANTRATYWQETESFINRTGYKPDDACTFRVKFADPAAKDGALVLQTASGKFVGSGKNSRLVPVAAQNNAITLQMEEVEQGENTETVAPPTVATSPAMGPATVDPGRTAPLPLLAVAAVPQGKPTIWLIGDSTVSNSNKTQKGWGNVIGDLFDADKVNVINRARGGRSSRTFLTEGLWDAVVKDLKPGDFVLMQFGHNDGGRPEGVYPYGRASLSGNSDTSRQVETKPGESEVVYSFGWYLRRYIADTRAKGATPIVLSLIPRNDWTNGKVNRAMNNYGGWAREAAAQGGARFVDLNSLVADKYDALGQDTVKPFFPDEHTHTSEAGARLNAQTVVEGLKMLPDSSFGAYVKATP